jgi:hypothetical protein
MTRVARQQPRQPGLSFSLAWRSGDAPVARMLHPCRTAVARPLRHAPGLRQKHRQPVDSSSRPARHENCAMNSASALPRRAFIQRRTETFNDRPDHRPDPGRRHLARRFRRRACAGRRRRRRCALRARQLLARPGGLHLEHPHAGRPRRHPRDAEGAAGRHTAHGLRGRRRSDRGRWRGRCMVHLRDPRGPRPGPCAPAQRQAAWTLLTVHDRAEGLRGKDRRRRIKGAEHGVHKGRKNWLEKRHDEEAALGYTEQPDC